MKKRPIQALEPTISAATIGKKRVTSDSIILSIRRASTLCANIPKETFPDQAVLRGHGREVQPMDEKVGVGVAVRESCATMTYM